MLTIQSGIPVARIELLDALQMKASNAYSGLTFAEMPTLFLNSMAARTALALQSKQFAEIAAEFGGSDFLWTANAEERARALEGPAQRLLGAEEPGARTWHPVDRCLRADLAVWPNASTATHDDILAGSA